MEPERRLIERLDDKGTADDDKAREEYDEHRRPITRVDESVVEPARFATGRQTQETTKQPALPAARASAHQPGKQRRHRRMGRLVRHANGLSSKQKGAPVAPPPSAGFGLTRHC